VRYRRVPLDNLIRPVLEKEARRRDVYYRTARFNLPPQYRPGAAWQAFPRVWAIFSKASLSSGTVVSIANLRHSSACFRYSATARIKSPLADRSKWR